MKLSILMGVVVGSLLLLLLVTPRLRADEIAPEYQAAIAKGLDWIAKTQHRDGHWEANGGQYPMAMTGLAGMALLMEGSTIREGKYADPIRRAVDWFMTRSQPNGLLGNPNIPSEAGRYMYGHGFGLLFLACVYGDEEDSDRRKKLEDILTRAVKFAGAAQTTFGGWGYISAADGKDFAEGSVTITQLQALRAARNAGIVVPKEVIDKTIAYLKKCTNAEGGVQYNLDVRRDSVALTSAAIVCGFSSGEYHSPLVKQWIKYCQRKARFGGDEQSMHAEYTFYYYAQCVYMLGDEGYAKLFPEAKESERLTWKKYRQQMFGEFIKWQGDDGSWNKGSIGPIFATSVYLTILQLDKGALPIYQR